MKTSPQTLNFQLGLLHFVHLLALVDGVIDDREKKAIKAIAVEEGIPERVFQDFEKTIGEKSERDIYHHGLELLDRCTDDEKRTVFVHLYRLSEVDEKIHVKEVRLLLYSLKASHIEFEDVELIAKLTKATNHLVQGAGQKNAA